MNPAAAAPASDPRSVSADFLLWINRSGTVLPLAHVPAAYKVACARPGVPLAASCLRSSVLALTADLQDFAPFAPETPSSPEGPRESNLPGHFLSALCPAPGGPCYQPPSDYYCSLSKEHSLESQGSSTLSSPSEGLAPQPAAASDCSPRGTSTAPLFQFPISKILEEEEATAGCPGPDRRGQQAQEELDEGKAAPAEETCALPSPHLPSPKRGPSDGLQGAEEIQRYCAGQDLGSLLCSSSTVLVPSVPPLLAESISPCPPHPL